MSSSNNAAIKISMIADKYAWERMKDFSLAQAEDALSVSQHSGSNDCWLEVYYRDTPVKPFFDIEEDMYGITDPLHPDVLEKRDGILSDMREFLIHVVGDNPVVHVADGSRVKKAKDGEEYVKFSLHVAIDCGHRISLDDLYRLAFLMKKGMDLPVDHTIYQDSRRALRCVCCVKVEDKDKGEAASLRPITEGPLVGHLVTNIDPTLPMLELPQVVLDKFDELGGRLRKCMTETEWKACVDAVDAVSDKDVAELLNMIHIPERSSNGRYEQWMRVSMFTKAALGDGGYDIWHAWCEREPGFNPRDNMYQTWLRHINPTACGNGVGALHNEAKRSSPEEYRAWRMAKQEDMFQEYAFIDEDAPSASATDTNASTEEENRELKEIMKKMAIDGRRSTVNLRNFVMHHVGNAYVSVGSATSGGEPVFYYFDGCRWVRDTNAARLHVVIADTLTELLRKEIVMSQAPLKELEGKILQAGRAVGLKKLNGRDAGIERFREASEENAAMLDAYEAGKAKAKELSGCLEYLSKESLRKSVIREMSSKSLTQNPGFMSKLDADCYLLGFDNGVVELLTGTFRQGRPDDYLTMSTGYDWAQQDDPVIQAEVRQKIRDMFATDEDFDHMLDVLAHNLCGNKFSERLWMLTGEGRNGKTVTMNLFVLCLGNSNPAGDKPRGYAYQACEEFFTVKGRDANAPSPAKAAMKGARVLICSEIQDKLNVSLLKAISGRDTMTGRELNQPLVSFTCQCGIFLLLNRIASIPGADNAFHRRLEVKEFPYVFVEQHEMEFSNHRLIDMGLKDRFEQDIRYRQQFTRMLVARFVQKRLGSQMWHVPESVKRAGALVMQENDPVRAFLADMYEWKVLTRCDVAAGKVEKYMLKQVFDHYMTMKDGDAYKVWDIRYFNKKMNDNGFQATGGNSKYWYKGLTLVCDWLSVMSRKMDREN